MRAPSRGGAQLTDVLIAGGGASGLAAAGALARAGVRSIVIEARDRLGGRIATIRDPRSPVPIELGPEFVHGSPEVTLSRLRAAGTTVVDNGSEGWAEDAAGRIARLDRDPFDAVTELFGRLADDAPDESVDAFLARLAPAAEVAAWTRALVAGFDAADPARASVRAIADEWLGDASADGVQSRPLGGYAVLVEELTRALDPGFVDVRLGHVVRTVESGAGGVTIHATHGTRPVVFRAPHAVVTLPAGVLAADREHGIAFEPPLSETKRAALRHVVMGPVRKIVLLFAEAFWEGTREGRFRDVAFFHQREGAAFPTFWTQVPVRAPFVVAWAGGPAAERIAHVSDDEAGALALREFGRTIGDPAAANAAFVRAFSHDWQRDPYAFGAYTYVTTGGLEARARLGMPEGRLAFAGEATAPEGEGGTVAGALESGERAARDVLAMCEGA